MNNIEQNRQQYFDVMSKVETIQLLLIGQDPYPSGANGIAFCKNTFDELYANNCCGKEVVHSLGFEELKIRKQFNTPIDFFMDLLNNGIAFINVSSKLLNESSNESLLQDKKYNLPFINKAQQIVILGKSKTAQLVKEYYPLISVSRILIHPSKNSKLFDELEWRNVWNFPFLKTLFIPTFSENEPAVDLQNYFNLDISPNALISKGNVTFGLHGIEEINGEFYASHFHLKSKIAKGEIKEFLNQLDSKALHQLASTENSDFHSWPEVEYEQLQRTKKYKFSWLVKHVIYSKKKYAEEIDFCRSQISTKAAEIMDSLVNDKSSLKTSKFNAARVMLEEIGKCLVQKELAPKSFLEEKTFNNIAMSLFLKGKSPYNMGVKLNKENTFPNFITYGMDFIHQCGNNGSHSNHEFDAFLDSSESQYLRNAIVYTTLGIVKYLKLYLEGNPKKNNWTNE